MKINISGFQGEGKSLIARKIVDLLTNQGKTVRLVDGCNSEEFRVGQSKRGKLKCWDVVVRVRNVNVYPPHFGEKAA